MIEAMTGDPKDRHVLAAAVKAGASVLVTANQADFPPHSTQPYGVEVVTADELLLDLLDASPATVVHTLATQAGRYKREPTTLHGLLAALSKSGARGFADEVRRLTS